MKKLVEELSLSFTCKLDVLEALHVMLTCLAFSNDWMVATAA